MEQVGRTNADVRLKAGAEFFKHRLLLVWWTLNYDLICPVIHGFSNWAS